ncbi:Ig-like domain repeat protein [Ensifer sp. 22564]|uniref:Ig-like domain repeat protein n=1 Tax=Ensifer sp. 22564 TaxID=3453943 RepID=UPI003F848D71
MVYAWSEPAGGTVQATVTCAGKSDQTITFNNPGPQNFGTTPTLTASASSGLSPLLTSATTGVCTIDGAGVLTFVTTGTCTINANQAGDASYNAAPQVQQSFAVNPAVPLAGAVSATVSANSSANPITLSLSGGTATSVAVGAPAAHGTATAVGATITYTPTPGYAGPDSFTYTATNAGGTSSPATVTITVSAPTIVLPNVSLAAGTVGTAYSQTLTASGGTSPYTFSVSGTLPAGLTLSPGGVLSGTPTVAGSYSFQIAATDSSTGPSAPFSGSRGYTLNVNEIVPVAGAVSATVNANSSANPITLNLSGGAATSVAIGTAASHGTASASGTTVTYTPIPGYSGSDSFTYTATNTAGTSSPATVTITVNRPTLALSPAAGPLPGGTTDVAYSQSMTASLGTAPYTYGLTITSGTLPTGLSFNAATGTLSGTPTTTGTVNFSVSAVDAYGASGSAAYLLTTILGLQAPVAGNASATVGANSANNAITLALTGGAADSVAVASAPTHGTASASGTTITYTPTSGYSGSDSFTYTATNTAGTSAAATVTITVSALPKLSINDISQAEGNSGTTSFTFTISLDKPAGVGGVTFDIATANGTANAPGDYTTNSTSGQVSQGATDATFTVLALGDTDFEPNETFFVNVTNVAGATVVDSQGMGTILNDDAAPAPSVANITPNAGATAGGTVVTITGTGFTDTTAVTFDGVAGSNLTVVDDGEVTVTTPAHAAGVVVVALTTPNGTDTFNGGFTYQTSVPTITASASDSNPVLGASVTFTATLAGGATPTGTVTFKNGSTTLGTVSVSGTTATFSTAALAVGAHSITAEYSGDANNAAAVSTAVTVTVGRVAPTVTVSASNSNPVLGASVTFTASLAGGASPTGTVTFKNGSTTLGSGSVSGTTATFSTAALAVGVHSITAEYSGDGNNAAAVSAAVTVTVGQVAPTVTVSASNSNPVLGASVTFTASLAGGASPTGSVTFKNGSTTLGTGSVSGITATFSTAALSVGAHSITAEYSGDSNNAAATSSAVTVTVAASTITFSPAGGALPEAMVGEAYSQQIFATGGAGALSYSLKSGTLPAGMILNISTGELTGPLDTAAEAKDYSFTIEARDGHGTTGTASYTLTVKTRAVTVTDKTVDVPSGSMPVNVNLEAGATGGPFTDASPTFVEPANAGEASIVRGEFAAAGPTPLGWYLKFIPNPAYSGTVRVGFRLMNAQGASNTGTVTYKIGYNPAEVADNIDDLVHGFVQTRQGLIASSIRVPGLLERRQLGNATDPVTARMTPSEDGITASFATSLAQMESARNSADGVAGGYAPPFNVWIDGTLMAHKRDENDDKWGNFAMLNLGADYLISEKALVGLSLHFDRMTDPTKEDAELTGNGWLAGPYASLEIGNGVFWDTSLLYGGSANDIDTAFWDGSFDTKRWLIDTAIMGEWQIDEATVLTPELRAVYFNETVKDYSVRNGAGDEITIEGFDAEQFRISLGAEIARSFTLENGSTVTPKLGATAGYAGLDGSGAYGTLTAGLTLETVDFWMLDASLLLDIESDGQKSVGGRVRAAKQF